MSDEMADEDSSPIQGYRGMLIKSAPDLTATTLTPLCYFGLFMGQELLTEPAVIPAFSYNDLPSASVDQIVSDQDLMSLSAAFSQMYNNCSSLSYPADFSSIQVEGVLDTSAEVTFYNFASMYEGTEFDITSDNGVTLNGFEGLQFPLMVESDEQVEEVSSRDFAGILGNTNGFSQGEP